MIRKIYRAFVGRNRLSRRIATIEELLRRSQLRTEALLKSSKVERKLIKDRLNALIESKADWDVEMSAIDDMISDQKERDYQYETHIKALQEELDTLKELTIPGLIASHKALIGRWEEEEKVRAIRTFSTAQQPPE